MKKTILFGYPEDYYMSELIRKNMIYSLSPDKFEIVDIAFPGKFKYKNFAQKSYNFFRKTFIRDKTYKLKLKFLMHENLLLDKLSTYNNNVDYTFLIRPDLYPKNFLKKLKDKSKKFIAYQWNGLSRFPLTYTINHYFDKLFVFDPKDLNPASPNISFVTNFYFDMPGFTDKNTEQKNELYYLATYDKKRIKEMEEFLVKIKHLPIEKNILIRRSKQKRNSAKAMNAGIRFIKKIIPYEENIHMAKSAKVLLEIVNTRYHQGLSFRVFEALCFDKKLITNNPVIKNYEFYKKENIFIIGEDDESQLAYFITSPYIAVDVSIKQKYSFTNWIKFVLDITPNLPIELPSDKKES